MKTHIIQWRSKATGRSGMGTRLLDKDEARQLADELNRDYPGLYHEAIQAPADTEHSAAARQAA